MIKANRAVLAWLLVQLAVARKCGTSITKECKATFDKRYDTSVSAELTNKAWSVVHGFYRGQFYTYDLNTMEQLIETDFFDTFTGRNRYQLAPSTTYLNFTVSGTRAYRHSYTFQEGRFAGAGGNVAGRPGRVIYCDSWAVSTWEKDSVAKNFKTVCSDDTAAETTDGGKNLLANSKAYPVDRLGIFSIENYVPKSTTPGAPAAAPVQETYDFKCLTFDCSRMSITHERFSQGKRTLFEMGDVVALTETEFTTGITQDYIDFMITDRDQVIQPMRAKCLNDDQCLSERDFCGASDPSCSNSPYQEPDGEVVGGAIVAFVFASVIFVLAVAAILYIVLRRKQVKRYRMWFAERMVKKMKHVDKTLLEFSPADAEEEFKQLEKNLRGTLNQDNMYEFMSTGPRGYMDYGDFLALWAAMDRKQTGLVDFLEFCSILGHCHEELARAKLEGAAIEASEEAQPLAVQEEGDEEPSPSPSPSPAEEESAAVAVVEPVPAVE